MPRREFLYDIRFWEAKRIIRGYRRRNILSYQLQRIQAWASMFCMGNPKHVKPTDIFKLYFDADEELSAPPMTEDEIKEIQGEIDAINATQSQK